MKNDSYKKKEDIISAAIKSTQEYLAFLDEQTRGIERYDAEIIDPLKEPEERFFDNELFKEYIFELPAKLKINQETSCFYISKEAGERIECVVTTYNKLNGVAKILFKKKLNSKRGQIEIDFRWLVRRTLKWYEDSGDKIYSLNDIIKLGSGKPSIKLFKNIFSGQNTQTILPINPQPKENQKEAIEKSLTMPLTYIWGPPGTGKTSGVLAPAALLMLGGKFTSLICAPTNNALENALEAIIRLTNQIGISKRNVLRLGVPSDEFKKNHPECCEEYDIEAKLSEIENKLHRIAIDENLIKETKEEKMKYTNIQQKIQEEHKSSSLLIKEK